MTLNALTAVRNEAAALLNESPVKKLSSKEAAEKSISILLSRLLAKQHELKLPNGKPGVIRKSSAMRPVVEAISQDAGATIEEISNLLVRFYNDKGKNLAKPKSKARGLIHGLHKNKGLGYRRIGTRYWLVVS